MKLSKRSRNLIFLIGGLLGLCLCSVIVVGIFSDSVDAPVADVKNTTATTAVVPATGMPFPALTPSSKPTSSITLSLGNEVSCIPTNTKRELGVVTEITDGDTIKVRIDGQVYPIRYIGIDTAERGEYYASNATTRNREFVEGKTVTLINDVSETDRFDRLLRYVLVDGMFVNYLLVKEGYARATDFPPDSACKALFATTENDASIALIGLWAPTKPPEISGDCDPSYPNVCIAPFPPDLNCGDISYRRFTVLPPDPHGFDIDNDGIGCESG